MVPRICDDGVWTVQDLALGMAQAPARVVLRALSLELPASIQPLRDVALVVLSLVLLGGPPVLLWAVGGPRRR